MRPAILGLCLLCGCAGWTRIAQQSDTTFAPRQQVQVWRGSQARVLHAVRLTGDTLVGIPFQKPTNCDSCRLTVPRSDVDSLRLGNMETSGILVSSLPFLALAFVAVTLAGGLRD